MDYINRLNAFGVRNIGKMNYGTIVAALGTTYEQISYTRTTNDTMALEWRTFLAGGVIVKATFTKCGAWWILDSFEATQE